MLADSKKPPFTRAGLKPAPTWTPIRAQPDRPCLLHCIWSLSGTLQTRSFSHESSPLTQKQRTFRAKRAMHRPSACAKSFARFTHAQRQRQTILHTLRTSDAEGLTPTYALPPKTMGNNAPA